MSASSLESSAASRKLVPVSHPTKFSQEAKSDAGISRDIIRLIGMEIGKDIVAYVEVMYPEAIKATSSTFKLSLRNSIHNAIVSIADLHDEAAIRKRLADGEAHRKKWVGMYRKMRMAKREKPTRPHERLGTTR